MERNSAYYQQVKLLVQLLAFVDQEACFALTRTIIGSGLAFCLPLLLLTGPTFDGNLSSVSRAVKYF